MLMKHFPSQLWFKLWVRIIHGCALYSTDYGNHLTGAEDKTVLHKVESDRFANFL